VRKGETISSRDIETVEVGGYNLPDNIAKSEDDIIGRYAAADLTAGDYILSSKVSFTPVSPDIQLSSIPSGKVAISLTVKSLAGGLSDKLQSGDIVRVYHYKDESKDIPELQFVKILAVTDSKGVNVDYSLELQSDEEKRQSATVTILASPEQARIITALENNGVTHVALICRNNEKLANELLDIQDGILWELYFAVVEDEDDILDEDTAPAEDLIENLPDSAVENKNNNITDEEKED
jgi:pilus assembly protein CpaB